MNGSALQSEPLDVLITRCQEEAGKDRAQETGCCFELFRRAVVDQDEAAWEAVVTQYHAMVCQWLFQMAGGQYSQIEVNNMANEAAARFWQSLTSRQVDLAEKFAHVGGILRYLRACTVSVFHDRQRQRQKHIKLQNRLAARLTEHRMVTPEDELAYRYERLHVIHRVREWVGTYVTDEVELLLLKLTFELDMTPAEIVAAHPAQFPDARTVRRVKERLMKRARRAFV